jgi:type IV secretory pathway TrbD component
MIIHAGAAGVPVLFSCKRTLAPASNGRFFRVVILPRCGEKGGVMKHRVMRSVAIAAGCLAWSLVLPLQGCALAAYGLGVATMAHDSLVLQNEE